MRKNKATHKKKSSIATSGQLKFWILGLVAIALIGGSAAALIIKHNNDKHTADTSQKTSSSIKAQTPGDTNKQGNTSGDTSKKGSTPSATYTPPTENNGITITPSTSGDKVVVSTQLAGYSDGTCTLTASNGTQTNTQTANVIYAPSYSTCAGFVVPISDLGTGNWSITIAVTSRNTTTSKTVTYEVQ